MEKQYLINDLVVMEDVCNANCQYCLTSGSEFKEKHNLNMVDQKPRFHLEKLKLKDNNYHDGSRLKNNLEKLIKQLDRSISPLILKVSGGEIFLVDGIMDFIKKAANQYKRIQILTNGTLLKDNIIDELSKIDNLSLQISLDGHTKELNQYRTSNSRILENIKGSIKKCSLAGIHTEINCVLTDANIEGIYTFAEYLLQYERILFLPYPVRGIYMDRFLPKNTQLRELERLMKDYKKFEQVLPPKVYLEEVHKYLSTGHIDAPCMIPQVILQSFDDGILSPCPNIWLKSLGNILENEADTAINIQKGQLSKIVEKKRSRIKDCMNCVTPWEIINLYLSNKITDEEMEKIFLYKEETILNLLREKKQKAGANYG